jgi:Anti-sigma-K factor rskA
MNQDRPASYHHRLLELMADQAAFGLSAAEESEFRGLLAQFPDADPDEFERLAAAIDLGLSPRVRIPLPPALRAKVSEQARRFFLEPAEQSLGVSVARGGASPPLSWTWLPWCAAAACLILAVAGWWRALSPSGSPDLAQDRQALLAEPSVVKVPLEKTDPNSSALGDIAWSDTAQRGFMRLSGLPMNDPRREQYQLWIFDKNQDPRYPIDGGVFDVAGDGEVIVPIRAAIRVTGCTMFAITVERPGGVVVSSRERIVLLGAVPDAMVN